MSSIKNNILYFVIFNIFIQIQSLEELPPVEDNNIVTSEAVIRKTINTIFFTLKLRQVTNKVRFSEYSAIHNLFVSITLQDHKNLNDIAKFARADKIDNRTQIFIAQINEVLNEDNKLDEAADDVYVTKYIDTFIKKLEEMKFKYGSKNHLNNFNINRDIMKLLKEDYLDDSRNVSDVNLKTLIEEYKSRNVSNETVLTDDEFWKPSGRRVYQGHRVGIKQFPFMASVQFFKKFQCGGSIIKSDLVITSASCLQLAWNNRFFRENPAFLSVQVGCDFFEGGDENIPIMEVYFHPEYDPKTLRNNLALMRLQRVLKFGKKVRRIKKIDIDRNPWNLPETTRGITIVGWGARSPTNILSSPWSNRLGVAELDFYPLTECRNVYSDEYVTNKNFCAGFFSKGGGACNRDVGGPGIVAGILVGVVSFGSPTCGATDAPTVFTKLGYYTDWIEDIMSQDVPRIKFRTTERPRKITYNMFPDKDKTTFKTFPITEKSVYYTPPEIVEKENGLRNDDILFKEFLATMFGNDGAKDYLDELDPKTENTNAPTTKHVARHKAKPKKQTETELTDTESSDDESNGNVKMVTSIDNFDTTVGSKEDDEEYVTEPSKYTALDLEMAEEIEENILTPRKDIVEQNIAKLISDIDIKELLESDEPTEKDEKELLEYNEPTKKVVKEKKKIVRELSKPKKVEEKSKKVVNKPLKSNEPTNILKERIIESQKHMYEPQKHMHEPQKHMYEPQKHVYEPQKQMHEPQKHMYEPQKQMREPQKHIYEPQNHMYEPQKHMYEPQKQMRERQKPMSESQKHMYESQNHMYELQKHMHESQKQMRDPQKPMSESQNHMYEPQKHMHESQKQMREPRKPMSESQKHMYEPQKHMHESQKQMRDPQKPMSESQNHMYEPQKHMHESQKHMYEPQKHMYEPQKHMYEPQNHFPGRTQRPQKYSKWQSKYETEFRNSQGLQMSKVGLQIPINGAQLDDEDASASSEEGYDQPLNDESQSEIKGKQKGLSISQESPFNDFKYRQHENKNASGLLAIFSRDELINLLSEVVEVNDVIKPLL